MSEARTARDATSRAKTERVAAWAPPSMLPDPHPEAGYTFRWVRLSTLGNADPTNISAKLRSGWEPVRAADHPEVFLGDSNNRRFPEGIEVGGLLLCKAPTELIDQRNAYYANSSRQQMEAVDNNFMRENDARMPLFKERRTEVTFGRGS